jgi:hypothetical protein
VKQADDIVLLAIEGKILQGMTDRLTEVARWDGMEMNRGRVI